MILTHYWGLCSFPVGMAISVWNATKDPEVKNGYLCFCLFLGTSFMPGDGFNSTSWTESRICEVYKLDAIN